MKSRLLIAILGLWRLPLWAAPPAFNSVTPVSTQRDGGDQLSGTVGLYEKLQLGVDLQATYSNPFDPDEIDLWAEFTAPSGKCAEDLGLLRSAPAIPAWMVRFAPTETGTWKYRSTSRDREGTADSPAGRVSLRGE